jgi:hypothetical protein
VGQAATAGLVAQVTGPVTVVLVGLAEGEGVAALEGSEAAALAVSAVLRGAAADQAALVPRVARAAWEARPSDRAMAVAAEMPATVV